VLQCVAVCCSVLQCVAVCCSVLQCVAVKRAASPTKETNCDACDFIKRDHVSVKENQILCIRDCVRVCECVRVRVCLCVCVTHTHTLPSYKRAKAHLKRATDYVT